MSFTRSILIVVSLLLVGAGAHAADQRRTKVVAKQPVLQPLMLRVVAAPVELMHFLLGVSTPESPWMTSFHTRQGLDGSLLNAEPRDTLQRMLADSSVRVWLRNDVNLHCDVTQQPAFASADQLVVKVGLQFRFR